MSQTIHTYASEGDFYLGGRREQRHGALWRTPKLLQLKDAHRALYTIFMFKFKYTIFFEYNTSLTIPKHEDGFLCHCHCLT